MEYRDVLFRKWFEKLGPKTQVNHDNRYDIADEYLEVLYKLWEGSWEEGSVLRDRESGIFADHKKCIQFSTKVNTLLYRASIFVNHHHSERQYFIKRGIITRAEVCQSKCRVCIHRSAV